jgi:Mn2+/Fe2+ NRAMP family transporter
VRAAARRSTPACTGEVSHPVTDGRRRLSVLLGPGLLVAATGVGAGDLATAAFAGSRLGTAVLWAVLWGAFFKFVLNEGLTRWQLATGETLIEGAVRVLGPGVLFGFLAYFLLWSFLVAAALMSAAGVAAHALVPLFDDPVRAKILFGLLQSAAGVSLVAAGGFRLFERVMRVCIGVMVVTVVTTAILLVRNWGEVAAGIALPSLSPGAPGGPGWTVALMGGVGGTVTVLCYGYWIREVGRFGPEELRVCRADLGIGYAVTALFGLAMVVLGSAVEVEGHGATLVVRLGERLGGAIGPAGRVAFLLGAWCAVFSSLLGVWQSVPYLFADLVGLARTRGASGRPRVDVRSRAYRVYLISLATIPAIGLGVGFARMQKLYAVTGALFMPLLALALLALNGRTRWVGAGHRNRPLATVVLVGILVFFLAAGWTTVRDVLGG